MPITDDWVATLRGDFYWQADSWARIFNDNPYDHLRGYDTLNLALILNSANGWSVMGYVKNVFNVTAITGDFLNSDDSGLTTNVFLTDPRLYGIRVTKQLDDADGFWGSEYSGSDFFTGLFSDKDGGAPPLWVELGGQLEHLAGQGAAYVPDFLTKYSDASILQKSTTPIEAQQAPLFSSGEEAKISFQPDDSDWVVSASVRYGRSGNNKDVHHQTYKTHAEKYHSGVPSGSPGSGGHFSQEKFVDTHAYHQESHAILDFMAGKDVGLGLFGEELSTVLSAGVRFAQYSSHSSVDMRARPDLHFKYDKFGTEGINLPYFHTYHATGHASRRFQGIGPSISWTGSAPLMPVGNTGLSFDWGANAALLFGRRKTNVQHHETGHYFSAAANLRWPTYVVLPSTHGGHTSNHAVTVPNLGGFAGVSYVYRNAKITLGYRTDMFIGAVDSGVDVRKSETLGMSGPFATVSFGLGG